jgi:hypothetical protein
MVVIPGLDPGIHFFWAEDGGPVISCSLPVDLFHVKQGVTDSEAVSVLWDSALWDKV